MNKSKIVILGAGLSGLSTAYHLGKARSGEYEIYEKESRPGGLCRSEQTGGFIFDYTGHLLHFRTHYAKILVTTLLGKNLEKHCRNSWIYSKNTYTRYPFQANTYGLPRKVVRECLLGFIEARIHRRSSIVPRLSFYGWILENFGKGIARHFMVPYNRKLWTYHPRQLTCDWMSNLVPRVTLTEIIQGAFTDQEKRFGYNVYFCYPQKGGIESLVKAFCAESKPVNLEMEATKIFLKKQEVEFNHTERVKFSRLVSTMPVPELIHLIDSVPSEVRIAASKLNHNRVLNINLGVRGGNICDKHWIYFPEREFIFYRVGFSSNFSRRICPPGTSSIYTEIAYPSHRLPIISLREISQRETDYRLQELVGRVIKDLIKARVLRKSTKILTTKILNLPYAYIIYDFQRGKNLKIIQDFLSQNNVYSIGRYGGWKYATMEDAILDGKQTAKELLSTDFTD